MNTHKDHLLRNFRSMLSASEPRTLGFARDPNEFSSRYELDRRSIEDSKEQLGFLDEKGILPETRSRIADVLKSETDLQKGDQLDAISTEAADVDGRLRTLLLTTDSHDFKNHQSKNSKWEFEGEAQNAGGGVVKNVKYTVDFSNPTWHNVQTEDAIAKKVEDCATMAALNAIGINFAPGSPMFVSFSPAQSKEVAKRIMIQYTRGLLATGMVGEANIRQAQWMMRKNPALLSKLEAHKVDKKAEKAKKDLTSLIDELKKLTGREADQDYDATLKEYKDLIDDLRSANFYTPAYHFKSQHFSSRFVDVASMPAADRTRERREGLEVKNEVEKDIVYYRNLGELLERIHVQMGKVSGLAWPTTGPGASIFAGGLLQKDQLDSSVNPALVSDSLKSAWPELTESHGHDEEAPAGVKAVTAVYAEHFKKTENLSDDEAKLRAYRLFFRNEMSKTENDILEEEIERATGGRLTALQSILKSTAAYAQAPFTGSDEAYICRIAESPEVGIPRAVGTASTTTAQTAVEGLGWTGTLATAGAGVGLLAGPVGWLALGGAAAGAGAYVAFKKWGKWVDRNVFGTRTLGFLWPRLGARPAWGEIKHDRRKLKIVWNAMLRGLREGKLNNTPYVKSQVKEVGRLLMMAMAEETGEAMALQEMSDEDWKHFSMANKRIEMQQQIHEMARYGAAGVGENADVNLVNESKNVEKRASNMQASTRRSLWDTFKGPIFGAYDDDKKGKKKK